MPGRHPKKGGSSKPHRGKKKGVGTSRDVESPVSVIDEQDNSDQENSEEKVKGTWWLCCSKAISFS